ncbi:hypothetical protein [Methanobrevibacter sp.]
MMLSSLFIFYNSTLTDCGFYIMILFIIYYSIIQLQYGNPKKYSIKDLGYFIASINKFYNDRWDETVPDSEFGISNCNIKVLKNRTPSKGRVLLNSSQHTSFDGSLKTSTLNTYSFMNIINFFEITYFKFNTKEDCNSNKNHIKNIFESRKKRMGGYLGYSSLGNVHIVCHAYVNYPDGTIFEGDVMGGENYQGRAVDVKRALASIKLK